jgi:hypothetical protein
MMLCSSFSYSNTRGVTVVLADYAAIKEKKAYGGQVEAKKDGAWSTSGSQGRWGSCSCGVHGRRHAHIQHYWNSALCRVLRALPSVFCRALGKAFFVECHTRQSPTLGNDHVYREQDSRHKKTLGKDNFVECQTLGEEQRSAKSRQQPSIANSRYLCQVSYVWPRQRMLCQVPFLDTRQNIFLFFSISQPNFLWYVSTLCRLIYSIFAQL